jgi:short-subunit dehydrogenase
MFWNRFWVRFISKEGTLKDKKLKDKWALVTGASSGLGVDFARELAGLGCNLILTARRRDRLEHFQAEIVERFGVSVKTIALDLSTPAGPEQLYDQIKAAGIDVDALINNAGFGIYGKFSDIDWHCEQELLQVNIVTVAHLTRLFVTDMLNRNFGFILNIASNGAYQPTPLYAIYAASKSFVLNFSEALNYELKRTNVKCTALSPGTVLTEFHEVAGQRVDNIYVRLTKMESAVVAHIGIKAMLKGRASLVPGWKVALMAWISQRAPRSWATAVTGWLVSL